MSELIVCATPQSLEEWKDWYLANHPDALKQAHGLLRAKVDQFRSVLEAVDDDVIAAWLWDLVINKTYQGLRVQQVVLKRVAMVLDKAVTYATAADEAKGIDGHIGQKPVSVKPTSHTSRHGLPDSLPECTTYYEKCSGGLRISFDETKIVQRMKVHSSS